jgi:hypothetical protein
VNLHRVSDVEFGDARLQLFFIDLFDDVAHDSLLVGSR